MPSLNATAEENCRSAFSMTVWPLIVTCAGSLTTPVTTTGDLLVTNPAAGSGW